jgi:hypothetical protein
MITTTFDKKTLEDLKLQYDAARISGKESFMFQDQELLVTYAKYLIEYLETKIK